MPEPRKTHSSESLVRRLKQLARRTGLDDIPAREFTRATGISEYHVVRCLGSYRALRDAAGLKPPRNAAFDSDTLLRRLRDACLKAGGIPPCSRLEHFGAPVKATYYSRWRTWRGTLVALRDWVEANDPEFPHVPLLSDKPGARRRATRTPGADFGAPLNFGPLLHEPTNELGVVVLFGVLAQPLGFAIERVGAGFPDCEAKQRVSGGWRRVRIEFEYQSRNFERHGHDPEGCDLIVCWEHNWAESPVPVLELRPLAKRGLSPEAGHGAPHANSQTN